MTIVSIITPLFNKKYYIAETIQSVLAQTLQNWEMLVIDNLSTDNSFEIAQQFEDPRIRFLQCHKQGPGATRNLGIQNATGEWIQFLDGDDLLEPEHLEHQLEVAQARGNADIIVSCWQEFTDANPNKRTLKKPQGMGKSGQDLKNSAIAYTPWASHAALVKRSILREDYLWPEELDQFLAEDTAFWFRLINNFSVTYSEHCGVLYRTAVPESRTSPDPQKWFEGNHQVIKNNLNYLENHDLRVTSGQMEYLIKIYTGIYHYSKIKADKLIQERCKNEINFWLSFYLKAVSFPKLSILSLKLLGLENYLNLVKLRLSFTI